jgi:serine/threonine-protein kinase
VNEQSPLAPGSTWPYGKPPTKLDRTLTQDYHPETGERCGLALVTGSGPCLDSEVAVLLRYRLRVAASIMAAALIVFWLFLFFSAGDLGMTWFDGALHAFVALTTATFAGILWSSRPLCCPRLRTFEVVLIGLPAALAAWMQYRWLDSGWILQFARAGGQEEVLRVALVAGALRWIILIVLYGTFIPSTLRRSAVVVGTLTLWPLAQSSLFFALNPELRPHMVLLVGVAIALGIAAAISIFGSYRISSLHQEAFEARKLGQYRLKQRLGSGGMGEVYLGEHVLLRRPCAIKLIRPDQAGDETSLRRFEREVQATATLTHGNTVEIYDYGRAADGTFYYVMEYLPGLSLQDLVDEHGPLPSERAVHLLRQVCGALREAHGIGLLHRDIKPSNILACERGGVYDVAKLVDFGLVRNLGMKEEAKLTQEGSLTGSPLYMSPEQARGRGNLDVRSDIYSLGGVAYFLLTGRPPFARDSAMEVLMAHVYEPVPPLSEYPGVPADLQAVVHRCLEKDADKRFPDIDSLLSALDRCESSGHWTEAQAAAWWRHLKAVTVAPPQPEPVAV